MDKFATLEPVKLYSSTFLGRTSGPKIVPAPPLVGRLPADLHFLVISHLEVPDIPSYSRCCRATAGFVREGRCWEKRWSALRIDSDPELKMVMDFLEKKVNDKAVPTLSVDDEFGDFTAGDVFNKNDFQDPPSLSYSLAPQKPTALTKYKHAHALLKPLAHLLASPPHLFLSSLAAQLTPSIKLSEQARTLRLLSLFLSSPVSPVRQWDTLFLSLRSAMDRFDSQLLAAFDVADGRGDEAGMREAAESSWEVWDRTTGGDWEMGKVWAEKREVFYQQDKWKALDNFTSDKQLNFAAMDEFMDDILGAINEHGARAVRVFPPASQVILLFSERLANEVVGEYITTLLAHAREISTDTYLKSAAASFREAWKMVDAIMQAAKQRPDAVVERTKAEDVVYQMFETNMDEYLDEEVEAVKRALDAICKGWDQEAAAPTSPTSPRHFSHSNPHSNPQHTQNPALLKRTVLASFTNILLLPVTIVPRTVGAVGGAIMAGGGAAVQGIGMLNPQRWVGGGNVAGDAGYSKNLKDGGMLFEVGDEEDEEDYVPNVKAKGDKGSLSLSQLEIKSPTPLMNTSTPPVSAADPNPETAQLDLLLSLDVALSLIHADRESLKRVETFAGYPGHYGHRVRDTIEELFVLMLGALGERHVGRGFSRATERMKAYKPAEHTEMASVAPLVQFFELVHIGDTIQSIMQVYFDKELAPHIDKTDFLNAVVREKKRFENSLDDSVAAGLNAGTEVLMNQVEHIILTLTKAREYYPPEDAPLELGPTKGCTEAIRCLENHCKLLKGSTSKEVLEVFYQEVGLRLIGILQKHIKRQIISLSGGFQVIADLNAYNAFVSSLKIPAVTADFSHLKMLGHVYIVEDAKDLAQIVKDVARYGGAYRPEDVYEFIQRRSDWKKIEKTVDKTMYNLSFKEDCVVC
ncbi:hypothetical protein GALMADRAFT_249710 [Galerina marginata CBS 339.88]|uniref:F-box domain-containing protein n=1 Tax=Galerina marginata (strain CBS 339.88) TaxID=685588 RepID=A0A067SXN2_GALM3|nr:hypothetical protein GALMADRAFT_249710 [Galerina marginata CBS 339.88]